MATVLIIDDEFGIAELLQAVLVDEGHTAITASNGKHGMHILESQTPDVIFLDYMMPIMDGASVLQQISARETLRGVPVVMMSSIPEEGVAQRCQGYVLFLRKPFSVFRAVEVVQSVMSAKNAGAAS